MTIIKISSTINFDYDGENLWGTVLGYGENNSLRLVTKKGSHYYPVDKMDIKEYYECRVDEFIKKYQHHNNNNFKYLYDFYGPYKPVSKWKED